MTGINIVHVPYKGAAPALADAMSGHMESSVGNLAGAPLAAVKSGRVRKKYGLLLRRRRVVIDRKLYAFRRRVC